MSNHGTIPVITWLTCLIACYFLVCLKVKGIVPQFDTKAMFFFNKGGGGVKRHQSGTGSVYYTVPALYTAPAAQFTDLVAQCTDLLDCLPLCTKAFKCAQDFIQFLGVEQSGARAVY